LTSIAVSDQDVFVADAGNRVVVRCDTSGNLVAQIGKKDSSRNVPGFVIPSPYFDLVVSQDGLLRVVNPGRRRIEAYTFDGDIEFWWGAGSVNIEGFCGCCNPVNIAVLPDGGYVTCEKGLTRVKVYDSEGQFAGVVAAPRQLVRDGDLRVCDLPEECQAGGFDVAVDSAGRIFVLDTIKNVVRIFSKIEGR
jgi:DNA-binding beta-propeller fold protein YncE